MTFIYSLVFAVLLGIGLEHVGIKLPLLSAFAFGVIPGSIAGILYSKSGSFSE